MVVLILFNAGACSRSVIIQDDSISFDESMAELESFIAEHYSLQGFDVNRIYLDALFGPGLGSMFGCNTSIPYCIIIEGRYGENETWQKSFNLKTKDDSDILVINSNREIIYNEELDESFYGGKNVVIDTPGWVIKGVYNTVSYNTEK